jgi:hypothetical protein
MVWHHRTLLLNPRKTAMKTNPRSAPSPPIVFVAVLSVLVFGCKGDGAEDSRSQQPGIASASFLSQFALVDTVVLEQPDSAPIVRLSGIDVDQSGNILLGDVSESNVKLFDRSGQLVHIFGRKGDGPGEFSQPRFPRFGPDGMIYVADAQLSRITVFRPTGDLIKTIPLLEFSPIMGFEPLVDGSFLVTGPGGQNHAVYQFDSAGQLVRGFLDRRRLRPEADPDGAIWRTATQYWLGVANDSVYVCTTLSDSLWAGPIDGAGISAQRLNVPGYVPPTPPTAPLRGAPEIMSWLKTFHIAASIQVSDSMVVIPFVKGVLNFGDPTVLAVRFTDRGWVALDSAPPVLAAYGTSLVAIHGQQDESAVLARYRRK